MAYYMDPTLRMIASLVLSDSESSSDSDEYEYSSSSDDDLLEVLTEESSSSEDDVRTEPVRPKKMNRRSLKKPSKPIPQRLTPLNPKRDTVRKPKNPNKPEPHKEHSSRRARASIPARKFQRESSCRGYVLVFVNYAFKKSTLKKGNDIAEIHDLFPSFGYQVRSFTNTSSTEILRLVGHYSKKKDSGSLICFLSSHGNQTSLACTDDSTVKIIDILGKANTDELKNRPKVFFIDACRSSIGRLVQEEHIPEPPSTEYFIGLSCLTSKTSKQIGSKSCGIYFEALIKVFKDGFCRPSKEDGKSRDIHHFMEKVHFLVSEQKDKNGLPYFQLPITKHTLTGKLFLQGE